MSLHKAHHLALALAGALLAGLLGSAAAQASPATTGSIWAGGSAYVTMALATPADECQLVASTSGRTPLTLNTVRSTEMNIAWVWQVPARARTATWRVFAVCGTNQISMVLTVHGHRHRAALTLARQVRVLQFGGPFPTPHQLQLGLVPMLARTWWTLTSRTILSAFHAGRSAGQCTDYVAANRPDIVERVDVWAYIKRVLVVGGGLDVNWVARDWAVNAQRAGIPTGDTPAPGAVMVFQPGAYGAESDGHVAIVDVVHSDGSFTVSAMHAPVIGRISTQTFASGTARTMASDPRISFIYG